MNKEEKDELDIEINTGTRQIILHNVENLRNSERPQMYAGSFYYAAVNLLVTTGYTKEVVAEMFKHTLEIYDDMMDSKKIVTKKLKEMFDDLVESQEDPKV